MKTKRDVKHQGREGRDRKRPALRIRLLVALLSPIVFLLALEVVLWIAGSGQPKGFFIRCRSAGETVYLANRRYCEHFVPKELSRAPEAIALGEKGPSTVRVFVLGGSAAFGDPDSAFGFCRQLEVLLNEHSPEMAFEVVNAAVTAMNSHVARRIARDCVAHEPDVFLVYMGNNEVVGPYGPPTLPATLYASRRFIDLCIAAKKESRLGQLINQGIQALRASKGPEKKWLGMEAFLAHQVRRDDARLKSCYQHFRNNLRDIVETAQACGAATVLCTVPTNLRSCAPFGSAHAEGLTTEQIAEWERLFAEGRALEVAGDFEAALGCYEQAWQLDATYADLPFCMGRCLSALEKPAEAQRMFLEARDLDTLRFRADGPINDVIRETAAGMTNRDVTLCDLETYLQERSRDHLLGHDLLADHVHLNFRGNLLAACAATRAIKEAVPQARLAASTQTEEELFERCASRLLYNKEGAYRLAMVMYRRKTQAPFEGQIDHDRELARLRGDLVTVYGSVKRTSEPESWYLEAIAQAPFDSYLNVRYGEFLLERGRISDAVRAHRKVLAVRPFCMGIRVALAQALAHGGMQDEAIRELMSAPGPVAYSRKDALLLLGTYYVTNGRIADAALTYRELEQIDPDNVDVLTNLAAAASHAGDLEAMKRSLDRALKIAPQSIQALINMGNYYAKKNQPGEAQKWFSKAVQADPQDYLCHIGLGIQSIRLGQLEKGIEHVRKAVVLKPDFAEGYGILATVYDELGRADAARQYAQLRDLFQSRPEPPPAGNR